MIKNTLLIMCLALILVSCWSAKQELGDSSAGQQEILDEFQNDLDSLIESE